MFKFLFMIAFFLVLLLALAGFSVLRMFKTMLFGDPDAKRREAAARQKRQAHRKQAHAEEEKKERAKRLLKEDSEYVDYEEVSD